MLRARAPHPELRVLDPVRDHQRIVQLTTLYEFPWDSERALELAFFRTFAVPSIGRLLARTGEFMRNAEKRYDDTELLIAEFVEDGYDGPRGRRAIARMNAIHARFAIANDDYLYTLSTFVCEPTRWMERFAWRPLSAKERRAAHLFWAEVGRRMGIRDVPGTYEELEAWNRAFERERFAPDPGAQAVARATRDLLLRRYLPAHLHHHGALAVHALLDDPLLEALALERPPTWLRGVVERALRARSRVVGRLPRPARPTRLTEKPRRTYPGGYAIEELGPPARP